MRKIDYEKIGLAKLAFASVSQIRLWGKATAQLLLVQSACLLEPQVSTWISNRTAFTALGDCGSTCEIAAGYPHTTSKGPPLSAIAMVAVSVQRPLVSFAR